MTTSDEVGDLIATLRIVGYPDHAMFGPVTIGRDPRADDGATIEVDGDPLVSKSHLCIDLDQSDLIITDLGSSNGTFLHHAAGETAVPSDRWIPIPEGAQIEFGDQRMTIERAAPAPVDAAPAAAGATGELDSDDEVEDGAATIEHAAPSAPVDPISGSISADQADVTRGVVPADPPSSIPNAAPAPDVAGGTPCTQCHRELPPGSKFCDGCGTPVMPSPAAHTPPPAVAPSDDDAAGRTVVIPPGGFVPGLGPAAAGPAAPPDRPAPQYGVPAAGPTPQGPPPGQYGQSTPPPGPAGPAPAYLGAPGQPAGVPVFVDPSTAASSKGGAGKKVLLGVGALVVLGLIGFALVTVLGGDDDSAGGTGFDLAPVATEIDELWSTDVAGAAGPAGIGDTSVYVGSNTDSSATLTSLDRENGDERWEVDFDESGSVSFVGEYGDVAVVSACTFGDDGLPSCDAVGLDRSEGDEVWRDSIDEGTPFAGENRVAVFAPDAVSLLDPATGETLEEVGGVILSGDRNGFLVNDDQEITVYDEELQPVFGPVDVDDEATVAVYDGERLLVAIGDEIEYLDSSGESTPGPRLDGDISQLVSVDSSTLVTELGDEVVVYDLDGVDAVERWSERGTLVQVLDPDGGVVVIVESGSNSLILDLENGDDRFDVDSEIVTIPASNALVTFEGPSAEQVTAYEWTTGDEIWSDDLGGFGTVGEIVVVIEADGDVVAYG